MREKDILQIADLATFERVINRDPQPYDINMMVMPGTLEHKHRNVDPAKGIPALRRQFNLIYVLHGGDHDLQLGADRRWLQPNDLVIVPEGMVSASSHVNKCQGFCVHFKTEFVRPLLQGPIVSEFPYLAPDAEHIISLTDAECHTINTAFQDIIREYERFSPERDHILRNYIMILLLRVRDIHRPHSTRIASASSAEERLTAAFKRLVEAHFVEVRSVSEYAGMLNVSSAHLGAAVRTATGNSPRHFINAMLLLEAKVLLRTTERTAGEIAHDLRFTDQAHFGHFIRKHTGFTPQQLRSRL